MTNSSLTGKDPVATAVHQLGSVEFFRSGAYVNLNDIAKPFGKRIDNWMRLKSTKELFVAFAEDPAYGGAPAVKTVIGRQLGSSLTSEGSIKGGAQGTFAHPHIAIAFAQWCSPKFQLWVSRQIEHLLIYGEVNLHYTEWTEEKRLQGIQYNRDDIADLYGKGKSNL